MNSQNAIDEQPIESPLAAPGALPESPLWLVRFRRWNKPIGLLIAIVLVAGMPFFLPDNAALFKATSIVMWMSMGLAWNWVAGLAGRIDLSFGAYFATGAYLTGYLTAIHGWDIVSSVAVGAIVSAVFAAVVGTAFLRLQGMSFSIATLCVYLAAEQIPPLVDAIGGGAGLSVPMYVEQGALWFSFGVLALVATVLTFLIRRSQFGLALLAAREDELSADARGVNIAASQVTISSLMGLVMGLVGGLWALQNGFVSPPTVFTTSLLLFVLILVLVGGIGTVLGPVIGAIVFIEVNDFLWNQFLDWHDIILSIALMVLALFAPHGLSARTFQNVKTRLRSRGRSTVVTEKSGDSDGPH